MKPSRKIFAGSSAIITSVFLEVIVAFVGKENVRELEIASGSGENLSDSTDQILEATHWQVFASLVGHTLAMVLFLVGAILLIVALYQTACMVERLQNQVSSTRNNWRPNQGEQVSEAKHD